MLLRNVDPSLRKELTSSCNLVLISRPSVNTWQDFAELAQFIHEADPRVHATVLSDEPHKYRRQWLRLRRTMLFSPAQVEHFRLRRGRAWQGSPMSKSEEMERLVAAGIPIPPYELLTEQQQTKDLSHLGDYVVTKPDRGGRGANVLLVRTDKVKWAPQETMIAGKSRILVAQEVHLHRSVPHELPRHVAFRRVPLVGQDRGEPRAKTPTARRKRTERDDRVQFEGLRVHAEQRRGDHPLRPRRPSGVPEDPVARHRRDPRREDRSAVRDRSERQRLRVALHVAKGIADSGTV